jgi:hypothetical protein
MMSATQREALSVLGEICELSSDVRFGQLLAHLGFLSEDQTDRSLWDIDDQQLLEVLHRHRAELKDRTPDETRAARIPSNSTSSLPDITHPQMPAT